MSDDLSQTDRRAVVTAAFEQDLLRGLVFQTICETRATPSEIAALKIEDLVLREHRIVIRGRSRPVSADKPPREAPITAGLAGALSRYLGGRTSGAVFESRKGGSIAPRTINWWAEELSEATGLDVTPLKLRRPDGTLLAGEALTQQQMTLAGLSD